VNGQGGKEGAPAPCRAYVMYCKVNLYSASSWNL